MAQDMGYLTVTEDIDPEDWAQPGVAQILEQVKHFRQMDGKIILLHDAGGDRSQTVAALPLILDYLEDRGDSVVSLSRLLGESPEVVMPHIQKKMMPVTRMVSGSGFRILSCGDDVFVGLYDCRNPAGGSSHPCGYDIGLGSSAQGRRKVFYRFQPFPQCINRRLQRGESD